MHGVCRHLRVAGLLVGKALARGLPHQNAAAVAQQVGGDGDALGHFQRGVDVGVVHVHGVGAQFHGRQHHGAVHALGAAVDQAVILFAPVRYDHVVVVAKAAAGQYDVAAVVFHGVAVVVGGGHAGHSALVIQHKAVHAGAVAHVYARVVQPADQRGNGGADVRRERVAARDVAAVGGVDFFGVEGNALFGVKVNELLAVLGDHGHLHGVFEVAAHLKLPLVKALRVVFNAQAGLHAGAAEDEGAGGKHGVAAQVFFFFEQNDIAAVFCGGKRCGDAR